MFGYVLPHTAELRVREWHAYRAYYCGLCKELQREYGFLPRMLLNYDLVLPALLVFTAPILKKTTFHWTNPTEIKEGD